MIILDHGDVMLFECKECGCRFKEAVHKTPLAHEGIWCPEKHEHGTRMQCPDCGNDVIGYRMNKKDRADATEAEKKKKEDGAEDENR